MPDPVTPTQTVEAPAPNTNALVSTPIEQSGLSEASNGELEALYKMMNDDEAKLRANAQVAAPAAKPAEVPQAPVASPTPAPAPPEVNPLEQIINRQAAPQAPTTPPVVHPPGPRSYEGLNDVETAMFKKMPNDQYAALYPIFLEHKTLKPQLTELETLRSAKQEYEQKINEAQRARFYDHPDAYTLSEDHQKLMGIATQLLDHKNFYQRQLARVDANQPYQVLVRNDKNELVISQPIQPSPESRGDLISRLTSTQTDFAHVTNQIQNLRQDYTNSYKSHEANLNRAFTDLFGKFEGALKPSADKELERFPHYVRAKPEVKLVAYGLAAMRILSKQVEEANLAAAAAKVNAAGAVVAGPTSGKVTTASPPSVPYYSKEEEKLIRDRFQL